MLKCSHFDIKFVRKLVNNLIWRCWYSIMYIVQYRRHFMAERVSSGASPRSFDRGNGSRLGRGMDSVNTGESKPPTPKIRFLFGFRPLYFGNIGKSEILANVLKIFLKNHDFWGISFRLANRGRGGGRGGMPPPPPPPPMATTMGTVIDRYWA